MSAFYYKLQEIFAKKNLPFPEDGDSVLTLDSLNLMMLIYEIETAFGIKFGLNDFDKELSVSYLVKLIESKS